MPGARFITFGGGRRWHRAADRIARQAEAFDLFDEVAAYTARDLRRFTDFWKQHGAFIRANRRGYGYWLWKPFLILESLKRMETGDILFYADAGCELNVYGLERMKDYLSLCSEGRILNFELRSSISTWTKMDTIVRVDPRCRHAQKSPYAATLLFFAKTNATMELVEQWYGLCTEDDYRYLDDSSSHRPNHRDFREHRHDQAILSLLVRKHGFGSAVSVAECWFGPCSVRAPREGSLYPVWFSKNASGVPSLACLTLHRERNPKKFPLPVWAWLRCRRRFVGVKDAMRSAVGRILRRVRRG